MMNNNLPQIGCLFIYFVLCTAYISNIIRYDAYLFIIDYVLLIVSISFHSYMQVLPDMLSSRGCSLHLVDEDRDDNF